MRDESAFDVFAWSEFAVCAQDPDIDPELFHPVGEVGAVNEAQIARAKAVCAHCPVRQECAEYALAAGLDHGIFGGKTAEERRLMRRNLFV